MDVEVLVLGGGPAGCATALSLVNEGIDPSRITVVEASDYGQQRIGESIPPDSRQLFDALGVLADFESQGHEPCVGSASSWGSDELGCNDFLFNPFGNGWHLDRRRFDTWLAAEAENRGAAVRRGCRLRDVLRHGADGALLRFGKRGSSGKRVAARFVVDATGARSVYARRMGAVRRSQDRLVSVTARFRLPDDGEFARLTFLEAVEYGWWYAARLPDRHIAAAVATSHALYKQLRFDRRDTWLAALSRTRHLAVLLSGAAPVDDSFAVCIAPSFILDRACGDHWLAVGDAASAYDPISSQGIYKALCDGLHAGRLLATLLRGGSSDDGLREHQLRLDAGFAEYRRQRAFFYDREQRWQQAPFWVERCAS